MVMTELFGTTRDVVRAHYALLTEGGRVPTQLPGWEKAVCHVLISPALGAGFSQLLITLEREGQCAGNTGVNQYFVFLLEGSASVLLEARKHRLEPGGYAYLPSGQDVHITSGEPGTRLLMFQKGYRPLPGVARPAGFAGHEREAKAQPLGSNGDARLQALLPDEAAFDMAVNILTCAPGGSLPAVEAPGMERGWMILQGQGLWRLEADWHLVQARDVIWAASYCPQWFLAFGKAPARCICYQEANRDPM
jgi:(S)-ureidoglycine aminohydrolase